MDQLMRANWHIVELLGAVFDEVERQGRTTPRRDGRPSPLRCWVGRPDRARHPGAGRPQ